MHTIFLYKTLEFFPHFLKIKPFFEKCALQGYHHLWGSLVWSFKTPVFLCAFKLMHCKRQSAKHVLSPWRQSCLHAPRIICNLNVFPLFIHSFPSDKHCHTDEWELERANCICSVKGLHSLETQMSLTKKVITLSRHYHKSPKKLIWEIRCLLPDSCTRSQISYTIMFLIGQLDLLVCFVHICLART